jgi:hypothetical protein
MAENRQCRECGVEGINFRKHRRICRICESLQQHARKDTRYTKNSEAQRRKKLERHAAIDVLKSVPCADCALSFPPHVMDFDHRNPANKLHEVSQLINKSNSPWRTILEEVAKCDVVCVCCHRLRTWVPGTKWEDSRRRLVIQLKSHPCLDCGKSFHFCQMDFDHVRGIRVGPVPHMRSRQKILDEAAKCEVVCANCHRERTQKRTPTPRTDPSTVNRVWKLRVVGSPQSQISAFKPRLQVPALRPWHSSVGTMLDTDVADLFGVSKASVHLYRKRLGMPRFKKLPMNHQVDTHEPDQRTTP